MKLSRLKRKLLFACLASFLFFIFYNSKSLRVSTQDKKFLDLFLKEWNITQNIEEVHKDFESEFSFISTIQDSIVSIIKHKELPHCYFGNVTYYYENRKGFCYDRAALMEKFLTLYKFSYRHTFIYFGKNGRNVTLKNFFERGISSHAALEVKTKKGWMAVGTNANWLGLNTKGELLTFGGLRKSLRENKLALKKNLTEGEAFWQGKGGNYKFVYGIYSRHGNFFSNSNPIQAASSLPSGSFLPDYNLKMLFYNLR